LNIQSGSLEHVDEYEPCIRVRKDQLVRRDADYGAELFGQWQESGGPSATCHFERDRENRGAVSKGTGELAQGVQEEVVEAPQSYRDDQL